MRIGICDWGIGGLGFYNLLRADRPDIDVVYLGDQGFTPYGRVSTKELTHRIRWVLMGFRDLGVTEVVVACNAASTVLAGAAVPGVVAHGVIQPTIEQLALASTSVGVIGGRRTILSGSYRRPLRALGIPVAQRVAQPLSGLIEAGRAEEPSTQTLLKEILRPIRGCNRLVLACTHYVVLTPAIQAYMPHASIVDPATGVWKRMKDRLPRLSADIGTDQFFTTGALDAMETQAASAFGVSAKVDRWS